MTTVVSCNVTILQTALSRTWTVWATGPGGELGALHPKRRWVQSRLFSHSWASGSSRCFPLACTVTVFPQVSLLLPTPHEERVLWCLGRRYGKQTISSGIVASTNNSFKHFFSAYLYLSQLSGFPLDEERESKCHLYLALACAFYLVLNSGYSCDSENSL